MSDYMEMKEDLERLGFNLYPGCRVEAWEHANELGISNEEIIGKFSDHDILEAIWESARVMGMLAELPELSDEECSVCGTESYHLMECDNCGELLCKDCGIFPGGIFPGDERYCSEECAAVPRVKQS